MESGNRRKLLHDGDDREAMADGTAPKKLKIEVSPDSVSGTGKSSQESNAEDGDPGTDASEEDGGTVQDEVTEQEQSTEDESTGEDTSDSESYISDASNSFDAYFASVRRDERRDERSSERYMAEEKKKTEEYEREKETEFWKAALQLEAKLKAGKPVPLGPLSGGIFDLYCSEYFAHYYREVHAGKRMYFEKPHYPEDYPEELICGPDQVSGELHIYPEGHLDIFAFTPPSHASLEPITLKSYNNVCVDVIFLGNGYLKLMVELSVVMKGKPAMPTGQREESPPVLEFWGIWISDEERIRERKSAIAGRHRKIPSPLV
jgi:hypothetical protein